MLLSFGGLSVSAISLTAEEEEPVLPVVGSEESEGGAFAEDVALVDGPSTTTEGLGKPLDKISDGTNKVLLGGSAAFEGGPSRKARVRGAKEIASPGVCLGGPEGVNSDIFSGFSGLNNVLERAEAEDVGAFEFCDANVGEEMASDGIADVVVVDVVVAVVGVDVTVVEVDVSTVEVAPPEARDSEIVGFSISGIGGGPAGLGKAGVLNAELGGFKNQAVLSLGGELVIGDGVSATGAWFRAEGAGGVIESGKGATLGETAFVAAA